jgi:hypothetical protein
MLVIGKCQRQFCNGDLTLEWEVGKWYTHCLLCDRQEMMDDRKVTPIMKAMLPKYEMSSFGSASPTECKTNFNTIPVFAHHNFMRQDTR